jgi:hypothetical protein
MILLILWLRQHSQTSKWNKDVKQGWNSNYCFIRIITRQWNRRWDETETETIFILRWNRNWGWNDSIVRLQKWNRDMKQGWNGNHCFIRIISRQWNGWELGWNRDWYNYKFFEMKQELGMKWCIKIDIRWWNRDFDETGINDTWWWNR